MSFARYGLLFLTIKRSTVGGAQGISVHNRSPRSGTDTAFERTETGRSWLRNINAISAEFYRFFFRQRNEPIRVFTVDLLIFTRYHFRDHSMIVLWPISYRTVPDRPFLLPFMG